MKFKKVVDIFRRLLSQPARAVWIEIVMMIILPVLGGRHSLRGLCGLKLLSLISCTQSRPSQPARAVWIEIPSDAAYTDVDLCHSLRGLCGLKFREQGRIVGIEIVTACEGCVD